MSRQCDYSGKKRQMGKTIVRRGKAKKQGGVGQKVTGINSREWRPNLQKIKIVDANGTVKTIRVCVRYIKAGKFAKATRGRKKAIRAATS
jgi:large subunit ribosomal protein L28